MPTIGYKDHRDREPFQYVLGERIGDRTILPSALASPQPLTLYGNWGKAEIWLNVVQAASALPSWLDDLGKPGGNTWIDIPPHTVGETEPGIYQAVSPTLPGLVDALDNARPVGDGVVLFLNGQGASIAVLAARRRRLGLLEYTSEHLLDFGGSVALEAYVRTVVEDHHLKLTTTTEIHDLGYPSAPQR